MWLFLACTHPVEPISQMGGEPIPALTPAPAGAVVSVPFTVEDLRAAFPVGHTLRFRVREVGKPDTEHRWLVTAADDAGMTLTTAVHAEDGTLLGQESGTSTWAELLTHGQFPAATTVMEDATITTPAGTFDAWKFTVVDQARDTVKRLHFARSLPGPPVLMTVQEGKGTTFEMILVDYRRNQPQ